MCPGRTGKKSLEPREQGSTRTTRPGYDARVGGRELGPGDNGVDTLDNTVQWVGGDIDLVITTTAADTAQTPPTREFKTYAWTNPKCLRVAFMYEDAVDPTNSQPDDLDTAAVDETLEGAYKGSEFPVKRPDDENDAPVFTTDGTEGALVVSRYTATRMENAPVYTNDDTASDSRRITEAFPARDPMADEDDDSGLSNDDGTEANRDSPGPGPGPDILTYSLSGPDAKYFKITGNVDTVRTGAYTTSVPPDPNDSGGTLEFKTTAELKAVGLADLDFETKRVFTVIITAADPSGDKKATVTVTVHLTDYNEPPAWVIGTSPAMVVYAEDRTDAVAEYKAKDPETTVNYGLVRVAVTDQVEAAEIADRDLFEIDPLGGTLRFKSSPQLRKAGGRNSGHHSGQQVQGGGERRKY